jgi:hypothetical protein
MNAFFTTVKWVFEKHTSRAVSIRVKESAPGMCFPLRRRGFFRHTHIHGAVSIRVKESAPGMCFPHWRRGFFRQAELTVSELIFQQEVFTRAQCGALLLLFSPLRHQVCYHPPPPDLPPAPVISAVSVGGGGCQPPSLSRGVETHTSFFSLSAD